MRVISSQLGCLTSNTKARIHSCERGMRCEAITENTIWIRPIVTRNKLGLEIAEAGVGGGGGDLSQRPELEFDSDAVISQLLALSVYLYLLRISLTDFQICKHGR